MADFTPQSSPPQGDFVPQAPVASNDAAAATTTNASGPRPRPIKRRRRSLDGEYVPTPTTLGGHHTSYRNNTRSQQRRPRHRRQNSGPPRPQRPPYFATTEWGPWHLWINGKATDPENDPPATEEMLEATKKFDEEYGEELKVYFEGLGEDAKKFIDWNYPVWWLSQGQWVKEDGQHAEMRWMALSILEATKK